MTLLTWVKLHKLSNVTYENYKDQHWHCFTREKKEKNTVFLGESPDSDLPIHPNTTLSLLLVFNIDAKGLCPVRWTMTGKAAMCVGTRHQRAWQSVGIWCPGNEKRLVLLCLFSVPSSLVCLCVVDVPGTWLLSTPDSTTTTQLLPAQLLLLCKSLHKIFLLTQSWCTFVGV